MEIKSVGIVGCGVMGSGIAQVVAAAGYDSLVCDVSQELIDKGMISIEKSLARMVNKGSISEQQKQQSIHRLKGTTSLDDLKECDIIIEAVTENLDLKRRILGTLDDVCKSETVFATNTSSYAVTEMISSTNRPERLIGMHFFNPVPLMRLVEVIRTICTSADVYNVALKFVESLGKVSVTARDTAGFIVNRLLIPYLLDAIRALDQGVGSITDIDNAVKLGCGYPMGPFTLLDLIGLDTTYYIACSMFDEFRETRFAGPPLLKRLVLAGYHGKKSGRGFYDWADPKNPKPIELKL
jgi:3-hydroxybutyryl-CoA dehydrogenase